jgi:hypothetical protein
VSTKIDSASGELQEAPLAQKALDSAFEVFLFKEFVADESLGMGIPSSASGIKRT